MSWVRERRRFRIHPVDRQLFWDSLKAWCAALVYLALVLAILAVTFGFAFGQTLPTACPPDAKTCKIITLTPQEEQALLGPEVVVDERRVHAGPRRDVADRGTVEPPRG
jgi:hypothetical protein